MPDSGKRSFVKSVSWRVVGTLDTVILSYLITGRLSLALSIGFTEILTKIFLYYLHERLWNRINWGREATITKRRRSIVKSITWRLAGSIDTTLLALFFSNDIHKAMTIGGVEFFTKTLFYYLHERVWSHIEWGKLQEPNTQSKLIDT